MLCILSFESNTRAARFVVSGKVHPSNYYGDVTFVKVSIAFVNSHVKWGLLGTGQDRRRQCGCHYCCKLWSHNSSHDGYDTCECTVCWFFPIPALGLAIVYAYYEHTCTPTPVTFPTKTSRFRLWPYNRYKGQIDRSKFDHQNLMDRARDCTPCPDCTRTLCIPRVAHAIQAQGNVWVRVHHGNTQSAWTLCGQCTCTWHYR